MAEERVRIEIGFVGGQTLGALVGPAAFEAARSGLANPDGVIELDADDGTYLLPARSVAYLKRWSRESQIGFGRAD